MAAGGGHGQFDLAASQRVTAEHSLTLRTVVIVLVTLVAAVAIRHLYLAWSRGIRVHPCEPRVTRSSWWRCYSMCGSAVAIARHTDSSLGGSRFRAECLWLVTQTGPSSPRWPRRYRLAQRHVVILAIVERRVGAPGASMTSDQLWCSEWSQRTLRLALPVVFAARHYRRTTRSRELRWPWQPR